MPITRSSAGFGRCRIKKRTHADHSYALANFDRRFIRKTDSEPGILECKSTSYHKAADWAKDAYPLYYEFQLRFYLSVADVQIGDFSAIWGNNPETDFATPGLIRDKAKEDMIFEKLDYWIFPFRPNNSGGGIMNRNIIHEGGNCVVKRSS